MKIDLSRPDRSAPPNQLSVLLSPTRRGARLARLLTVAHLASWGLPSERAEQVVAELAANAVLHGVPGRDFRLTLTVTDRARVRVEVTDTRGEALPSSGRVLPPDDAESGRGLLLVEALADAWGVDAGPPPRKTVWAELDTCHPHRISSVDTPCFSSGRKRSPCGAGQGAGIRRQGGSPHLPTRRSRSQVDVLVCEIWLLT